MPRFTPTVLAMIMISVAFAGAACGSSTPVSDENGVLTVESPEDGSTVVESPVIIRGTASANEEVRRDKRLGRDDKIKADAAGAWEFEADLDEGENEFEFFLQDAEDTRVKLSLTYEPSQAAGAGTVPVASATPSQTGETASASPNASTSAPAITATPARRSLPETLPGIAAADVTINLEDRGFDCSGPDVLATLVSWTCKHPLGWVDLLGESPTRIRSVSATSFEPNDEAALDLLGYISTLPYDGAEPERARAWLVENIATGGGIVIGPASFNMYGPAGGRTLEVWLRRGAGQ